MEGGGFGDDEMGISMAKIHRSSAQIKLLNRNRPINDDVSDRCRAQHSENIQIGVRWSSSRQNTGQSEHRYGSFDIRWPISNEQRNENVE